ncbi:MAG: hypothetical protein ABII90_08475 [Bacteroidota bacterium]
MRILFKRSFFLLLLFIPVVLFSQPPKSYQKQFKKQEKAENKEEKSIKEQEKSGKKLLKFKQKLAGLDKQKKDAEASGDQVKIDKINKKIRQVKGKMGIKQDKIEKKIVKKYQEIQAKEVQKRMKKSKKKANRINENKRRFFLIRWFMPKRGR